MTDQTAIICTQRMGRFTAEEWTMDDTVIVATGHWTLTLERCVGLTPITLVFPLSSVSYVELVESGDA